MKKDRLELNVLWGAVILVPLVCLYIASGCDNSPYNMSQRIKEKASEQDLEELANKIGLEISNENSKDDVFRNSLMPSAFKGS